MITVFRCLWLFALFAYLKFPTAYGVTWEDQAERLQKVSATLLDGVPFTDPVTHNFSLQLQIPISILPKVDPKVGAKSEKVPSSPVHTIPSVKLGLFIGRSPLFDLGVQLWGGYLMPGAESLVGIKAKLSQYAAGGAVVPSKNYGGFNLYLVLGGQVSKAELKGAITGADASDEFRAESTLLFISPGFYDAPSHFWGNVTIGQKTTDSRFEIPSDKTIFQLTDNLSDVNFKYFVQGNIGFNFPSGIRIAFGELWVPARLLMPRLLIGYAIIER